MRFLAEDVSYCSLSRTRLKFSLLILYRKVLRSHATYRYSYYKVLYLIAAQGIFLAASQRKIRCFFGSGAYSCRCANGVRVSDDMQDAAPHHTAVYHAPCSAAARRHLYETKMSEHAAPTGKSSATAIYAPSPYDKQRRYISYGNKRHTVRSTHLKEDIRSTPCPYRARITCRFCLRCNDDARRENPASRPHA